MSYKGANAENAINIMYFQKNDNTSHDTCVARNNVEVEGHYVWIKNMSRALSKSTNDKRKKYFCVRCRLPYASREKLMKHDEECGLENEAQAKEMPHCPKHENNMKTCKVCTKARTCSFTKYEKTQELPIVIYFDCEAVNRKISEKETGL